MRLRVKGKGFGAQVIWLTVKGLARSMVYNLGSRVKALLRVQGVEFKI